MRSILLNRSNWMMQETVNDSQRNCSVKGKSVESKAWDGRVLHFLYQKRRKE